MKKERGPQDYAIERGSLLAPELSAACREAGQGWRLKFECTLAEAYAVLSVSSSTDAPALLALGARSAADAEAILRERGCEGRIRDNPWAAEAEERGVPFEPTLAFLSERVSRRSQWDEALLLDALEANGIACLRSNLLLPIPVRVLEGTLRLADIRTVGASRLARAAARTDAALDLLWPTADGAGTKVPAATVRALITLDEDARAQGLKLRRHPLDLAETVGAEVVLALRDTDRAADLIRGLYTATRYSEQFEPDYLGRVALFNEELTARVRAPFRPADVRMLFDAGAAADDVRSGLLEGLGLQEIAGRAEGVHVAVGDGWL